MDESTPSQSQEQIVPSDADAALPPSEKVYQDPAALIEQLRQEFDPVIARLESLQRSFDQKLKYDAQKDDTISKLHTDLDWYRQGLYMQLLRPMALDLLQLYNGLDGFIASFRQEGDSAENHEQRVKNLELFLVEIEETLNRNGFVLLETAAGSPMEAKRHKQVGTCATDRPDADRLIAQSVRRGLVFQRADDTQQIIQPEIVLTYRFESEPPVDTDDRSPDAAS